MYNLNEKVNIAVLINIWECLTTLSDVALSYKNAIHKSILEFTPLYTAARQNKVLVLLLVLFPVQILRAIFGEWKGLQRVEQTWLERGLTGHTSTAELEKVWHSPWPQIPVVHRLWMATSKPGWSHPSHPICLWAAVGQLCTPKTQFWGGGRVQFTVWKHAIFATVHQNDALITCRQSYIFCLQYQDIRRDWGYKKFEVCAGRLFGVQGARTDVRFPHWLLRQLLKRTLPRVVA